VPLLVLVLVNCGTLIKSVDILFMIYRVYIKKPDKWMSGFYQINIKIN
jgi:hypothetical protein